MDVRFSGDGPLIPGTNIREPHLLFSKEWVGEVVGNFAVFAAAGALFQRGKMFARTAAIKHIPSPWNLMQPLPFTIVANGRGALLFTLDVGFYKGLHPAYKVIQEQHRLFNQWVDNLSEDVLRTVLGPHGWQRLTGGEPLSEVTTVFEMPAAWLIDP